MYSIDFNQNLIKGVMLIDIDTLNPHEKIIEKKKTSLAKFIKSYESYYIISSIVCCHESFCLLYTSPSPRDVEESRMPSSA